jgi:hypothetical protein
MRIRLSNLSDCIASLLNGKMGETELDYHARSARMLYQSDYENYTDCR